MPIAVVVMLHSHLPYVLHHGRWPHGSDWLCEAAIDTYLPLIERLRALEARDTDAPLTIGFTAVLANQLGHPAFVAELTRYFEHREQACRDAAAELRASGHEQLSGIVAFWRSRFERLRRLWDDIGCAIPAEFRRLQDAGRIELTGSAATHGFLPLLGRDESVRLQLALGVQEHTRIFGRRPRGCWLPECACRPRGSWSPIAGFSSPEMRPGIDELVRDEGYEYSFIDAHMARAGVPLNPYGAHARGPADRMAAFASAPAPIRSPYRAYQVAHGGRQLAVLVRDPRTATQVWSRYGGYPGAPAYLEFHKMRWPGGLKLWRVTETGSDLGAREPYDPGAALAQAEAHARHFVDLLASTEARGDEAVVVAPFDAELFGHWWFEGPDFLAQAYTIMSRQRRLRPATASRYLSHHRPRTALRIEQGSWGRNGDYSMWLEGAVWWTWPVIWNLEDRFWSLAPAAIEEPELRDVLAQAARELLLLQSSDWQFIMSTGEVEDYAERRFLGHAADARELLDVLSAGVSGQDVSSRGSELARALRKRDDLFPEILQVIGRILGGKRAGTPEQGMFPEAGATDPSSLFPLPSST